MSLEQELLQYEVESLRKAMETVAQEVLDVCKHAASKGRSLDNINLDCIIADHKPVLRIQTEDGYVFEKQPDGSWSDGDMTFDTLDLFECKVRLLKDDEDSDLCVGPR